MTLCPEPIVLERARLCVRHRPESVGFIRQNLHQDKQAMAPPPTISKMYEHYMHPTSPRGGWFSLGDLRFALVIATFYWMILTRPVKFSRFHLHWHAVRYASPWKATFMTLTYPLFPIYVYVRTLVKSFIDLYCVGSVGSRPSGEADNASVFFALPPTLFGKRRNKHIAHKTERMTWSM